MEGSYIAPFEIADINVNPGGAEASNDKTLFYLVANSDPTNFYNNAPVEILSIGLTNATQETEEQLKLVLGMISSVSGVTGQTQITPHPLSGNTAALTTVFADCPNATQPTYTAAGTLRRFAPSNLAGLELVYVPETRILIAPGEIVGLAIQNRQLANDFAAVGYVEFYEYRGIHV